MNFGGGHLMARAKFTVYRAISPIGISSFVKVRLFSVVTVLNILHMKYAVEVEKAGSLNKASERLFVALPNISRSIKELESDLGITIFTRSAKGVKPTPEGAQFLGYAKEILKQIEQLENLYHGDSSKKQKFSISVPRACYISEAFAEFSKTLDKSPAEIFYKETNSQRAINNILNHDYKLGIIRYAEHYDGYFKALLKEKGLCYEKVAEFTYHLVMSRENPLAKKESILLSDLTDYIEIAHADPFVPSLPLSKVMKEELMDDIPRKIFLFERASQFDLLSQNPETFMWISPAPESTLENYGLVCKKCEENRKIYKDVLIYRQGYNLTETDRAFIAALERSKQKNLDENR